MLKAISTPFFLAGPTGQLFAIYLHPDTSGPSPAVLYLPPFGEEMNRSRRMASMLGQALGESGNAVLILDPSGTGDSAGELSEASWEVWLEDCNAALRWLAATGHHEVHTVGLRFGANLAIEVAKRNRDQIRSVVLWQPILQGAVFLKQLLRVRVAGGLGAAQSQEAETTTALRNRLRCGETIEVAGYPISPKLADQIEQVRLTGTKPDPRIPLTWFELVTDAAADPSPAAQSALTSLSETGCDCAYRRIEGEPFWSIEEPVINTRLIESTLDRIGVAT